MSALRVVLLSAEYAPDVRCSPLGDALRLLADALHEAGVSVTVVTPGYGLHANAKGEALEVNFGGADLEVVAVQVDKPATGVAHIALEHPDFAPHAQGQIYCNDAPDSPFATDATKFAFFGAAAAAYVANLRDAPDVVHAHDWHAAFYFMLREFDPQYVVLKNIRTVYTVHSVSVQGRRPLSLHDSSLRAWFPDLAISRRAVVDPSYADCVNPVAGALRLADAVCVPSTRFARDVRGTHGEGLGDLFAQQARHKRIAVIDEGGFPRKTPQRRAAWRDTLNAMRQHNQTRMGQTRHLRTSHFLAQQALASLGSKRPSLIATAVGPFDDNQLALLSAPHPSAPSILDAALATLGGNERLIMQGSATNDAERFLNGVAARQPQLVFLEGDSPKLAESLIRAGDFHLVLPASAPGAAQALAALNAGRPCMVHNTGGLHAAVSPGHNGWRIDRSAGGKRGMVRTFADACASCRAGGDTWRQLCVNAARSGTSVHDMAAAHVQKLYADGTL